MASAMPLQCRKVVAFTAKTECASTAGLSDAHAAIGKPLRALQAG